MDPQLILNLIAQTIFDKKGMNILALDVRGISSLNDYVIIAEGNIDKHVTAIAHEIIDVLAKQGIHPVHVEGMKAGDWVVIDYLDISVHLFMPGMRDKYQLEQLWKEGSIIDLSIDVSHRESNAYVHGVRD